MIPLPALFPQHSPSYRALPTPRIQVSEGKAEFASCRDHATSPALCGGRHCACFPLCCSIPLLLKQGLIREPWLVWNSPCTPGHSQTQEVTSPCSQEDSSMMARFAIAQQGESRCRSCRRLRITGKASAQDSVQSCPSLLQLHDLGNVHFMKFSVDLRMWLS